MSLRQGSRQSSRIGCWSLILIGAALLLPGARFVVAEPPADFLTKATQDGSPDSKVETASANQPVKTDQPASDKELAKETLKYLKTYAAGEALDKCVATQLEMLTVVRSIDRSILNVDAIREQSRSALIANLRHPIRAQIFDKKAGLIDLERTSNDSDVRKISEIDATMAFQADDLIVNCTAANHELIARELQFFSQFGDRQVVVETRFIEGNKELDVEGALWQEGADGTFAILDEAQVYALLGFVGNKGSGANILMAPKVTMFNGTTASINDYAIEEIETLDETGLPTRKSVHVGTEIGVKPVLHSDGHIALDYEFEFGYCLPSKQFGKTHTVRSMSVSALLESHKHLAYRIELPARDEKGRGRCVMILVRCETIASATSAKTFDPAAIDKLPGVTATKIFEPARPKMQFSLQADGTGDSDSTSEENKRRLRDVFKKLGIDATLEGDLHLRVSLDHFDEESARQMPLEDLLANLRLHASGKNVTLSLAFGDKDDTIKLRADEADFTWQTIKLENSNEVSGHPMPVGKYRGHVRYAVGADSRDWIEAEQVEIRSDQTIVGHKVMLEFGSDSFRCQADRAYFRSEEDFQLEGNVQLVSSEDGGMNFRGEYFAMKAPEADERN